MTIKTPVLCATLLFYCWNQNLITTMAEVKHMPPAHTNIARAGDLRRIPAIDAHICLWDDGHKRWIFVCVHFSYLVISQEE